MPVQLEYTQNNQLLWSDAQPVSWHSVAPNSHIYSLMYLPHPQHCPLILLGHLETSVQVQSITLWISHSGAKRNLKDLKIEVKTKASLDCSLSFTQPLLPTESQLSYFPKTYYMLPWQNCIISFLKDRSYHTQNNWQSSTIMKVPWRSIQSRLANKVQKFPNCSSTSYQGSSHILRLKFAFPASLLKFSAKEFRNKRRN